MRAGKYVTQLQGDLEYKAFVANPLPFDIKSDLVLDDFLSKANIALGRLDGIAEIVPDVDFFILMYVRKEATLSSQVEGTQATFCDVLKAEAKIIDMEMHKDVDEILNYIQAMNHGRERLETLPLSLRLIREIHRLLLSGVRGEFRHPGEFRVSQNWVGGATIRTASFVPAPPMELTSLLGNLEKFLHDQSPMPILIKTGLIHAQFENIHPFLDGNGRIGRLLITFYLCQQGILKKPLLYLSEFFKNNRQAYYDKLNAVHEKDDIESWLKFFLEGITITSDKAVSTARKILLLRDEDIHKVTTLGRSAPKGKILLDSLYRNPIITTKTIENIAKLEYPNALGLLNKFIKKGILKEITGKARSRVYAYQNYIDLFE